MSDIKEKEVLPSVSFNVGVPNHNEFEELYITGSIEKFGLWDPEKALKIKRTKTLSFLKTVRLPLGTRFQFKILCGRSWDCVEKGRYFEEIENREYSVSAPKNKAIIEVKTFSSLKKDEADE